MESNIMRRFKLIDCEQLGVIIEDRKFSKYYSNLQDITDLLNELDTEIQELEEKE